MMVNGIEEYNQTADRVPWAMIPRDEDGTTLDCAVRAFGQIRRGVGKGQCWRARMRLRAAFNRSS